MISSYATMTYEISEVLPELVCKLMQQALSKDDGGGFYNLFLHLLTPEQSLSSRKGTASSKTTILYANAISVLMLGFAVY